MKPGEFFTWSRCANVAVVDGCIPAEEMRARTLSITYVDRVRNFDHIEWELDNSDGLLTRPEYIAAGMLVRLQLGYSDGTFPWKAFIINRIQGGVGVFGKERSSVGDAESRVTYHGRNRNAPGGRTSRRSKRARAPQKMLTKTGKPTKASRTYGSTSDVTLHEMVLSQKQGPRTVTAATTSEAVEKIARRNGFTGAFAIIEPTEDPLDGKSISIPTGMSDGQYLQLLADSKGFIFKVDDFGLHWHSDTWVGAKPKLADTLIYGQSPDILEITVDCDFRLPVPGSISAKGYSYKKRAVQYHEAEFDQMNGEINIGVAFTDWFDDPAKFNALTRHEAFPTLADSMTAAKKRAVQRFTSRHMRAFQINVNTVGNPKLLAGRLVQIKGTGSPLVDGIKYITEARHLMEETTYRTEFTCTHPPKAYSNSVQWMHYHEPQFDKDQGQLSLGVATLRGWQQVDAPPSLRR